jgi:PEP-CTERM motif
MRKFGLSLVGAAGLVASMISGQAYATTAGTGGFTVSFTGGSTVNTGNITAATATKTITGPFPTSMPSGNLGVNGNATYNGSATGPVGPITVLGPTVTPTLTITVPSSVSGGNLTFSFNTANLISPIVPTGAATSGLIGTMFTGNLTNDSGGVFTTGALGSSTAVATLSQSCSQANTAAPVICSDSVSLTTTVTGTPEPTSLALLGSALIGFGWMRRRRKAA